MTSTGLAAITITLKKSINDVKLTFSKKIIFNRQANLKVDFLRIAL